jgi:hypothetical protein
LCNFRLFHHRLRFTSFEKEKSCRFAASSLILQKYGCPVQEKIGVCHKFRFFHNSTGSLTIKNKAARFRKK